VEQNWGLYELRPGRLSLEQVFLDLTVEAAADVAATPDPQTGAPS